MEYSSEKNFVRKTLLNSCTYIANLIGREFFHLAIEGESPTNRRFLDVAHFLKIDLSVVFFEVYEFSKHKMNLQFANELI